MAMPHTYGFGTFLLGPVLLLVGLKGGGFRVLGIEISAELSTFQRTLAFVLGVALMIIPML